MRRRYRLRRSADFDLLRRQGRRWHHPLVILIVRANAQPNSRFAFSASRRVGKAVGRNRAKRLLREAVRLHQGKIQGGWDCLFVARPTLVEASFAEIEAAIGQLLGQAGITRLAPQTEGPEILNLRQ